MGWSKPERGVAMAANQDVAVLVDGEGTRVEGL